MTQLFHAAICDQCGGSLDLKTLKCESCSVQHHLDFSKSIPSIASDIPDKEYFVGRDRRVDSVLLLMLQQIATEQKVEVALALTHDRFGAQIHIHAMLPYNSQWIEVGMIEVEKNHYFVKSNHSLYSTYINVHFSWQIDLTSQPRNRFYNLSDQLVRGETELLSNHQLQKAFSLMMKNALQSNQALIDAEERTRIEATQPINWLEKLLGA